MPNKGIRIGVDVGGTFTDFALSKNNSFHTRKLLTTHQAPENAIMSGLGELMTTTTSKPSEVEHIIHGTTLATNCIIEKKGARTAMLTTEGFRDVLQLGSESRFDQYDLSIVKPVPLVPRQLRFTVTERTAADGSELLSLDTKSLEKIAGDLKKHDVKSIAICFLHSVINPAHEQSAADELRKYIPDLYISLSSQVAPEIREYDRFSTTVANAYIQPLIDSYLERFQEKLLSEGYKCPLYLFVSNGALVELDVARKFPIRLVESGPAGGAVFASNIARVHNEKRILSFDMGGTTAKICLIDNARPQKANVFEMARVHRFKQGSGLPARIPVIEMVEIGAGGGSIAHVDELGRIIVGPDSAGSEPGPACYALGGTNPTVTDADLILGRLETEGFADGSLQLDDKAARNSVEKNLADVLHMEVPLASFGIAEIVEEEMANAAREHATESGKSLSGRTLVAFGGAAPLHALPLAKKLGIDRIIIPANAGVGSAVGFLLAPVAFELSRSCLTRLGNFQAELLNTVIKEMSNYAFEVVSSGTTNQDIVEIRHCHMRYVGQGYSIPVAVPLQEFQNSDSQILLDSFNEAYRNLYKKLHDGVEVEIVSVSVSASTQPLRFDTTETDFGTVQTEETKERGTSMFNAETNEYREIKVYFRSVLKPGASVSGAALVRDRGTTIMIPDGYAGKVADDHSLIIEINKKPDD